MLRMARFTTSQAFGSGWSTARQGPVAAAQRRRGRNTRRRAAFAGRRRRPTNGDEERHMIDVHYWTTPNGHKVTVFLEEAEKTEICGRFRVDRDYLRVLVHRAKNRFREAFDRGGHPQP